LIVDPFEYDTTPVRSDEETTPNGTLVDCLLKFGAGTAGSTPTFRLESCSSTTLGFGATKAHPVGLSDYGAGAVWPERTTRSWMLSSAIENPHGATGAFKSMNSLMPIWSTTGNVPLSVSTRLAAPALRSDTGTCQELSPGLPKTYSGGFSVDYCEDCQRVEMLKWGIQTASDVPDDICF
jgi:hypothetical protein